MPGVYCTKFCYSSESRKLKTQNVDFCSICLGRLRCAKYFSGCLHQCSVCHRPWLILNRQGVCRTCHALIRQDYYGDRASFKPERLIAFGDGAVNPQTDSQMVEARHIGAQILNRNSSTQRIIDNILYVGDKKVQ